jgi:hypothetical protein
MQTIETEVRAGLKTLRGAESVAAKLREQETIEGIRYSARPDALSPSKFVVVRIDGEAMREQPAMTLPIRDPFNGVNDRTFGALAGKKSRGSMRGNGRVFA